MSNYSIPLTPQLIEAFSKVGLAKTEFERATAWTTCDGWPDRYWVCRARNSYIEALERLVDCVEVAALERTGCSYRQMDDGEAREG